MLCVRGTACLCHGGCVCVHNAAYLWNCMCHRVSMELLRCVWWVCLLCHYDSVCQCGLLCIGKVCLCATIVCVWTGLYTVELCV